MHYLTWFVRIVLFLLLLGFAVKNAATVRLQYFFGYEWQAPLMLILLVFFTLGVAIGVLACLGKIFRQRREIAVLKKKYPATNEHEPPVAVDDRLK
jgi:putative membrane protein